MDAPNFDIQAEAFCFATFDALQTGLSGYFLDCMGVKARGHNREVLGLTSKRTVLDQDVVELTGIQVARNSMYDLLPEAMFHSLSLGNTATTTYELVEEIRHNRERGQGNRLFFIPFDTEFFYYSTHLLQRQIGWPTSSRSSARQVLSELLGLDLGFDETTSLGLVSFFAHNERAKDNAPLLADLLSGLLGHQVVIRPCECLGAELPGLTLGKASLGEDTVLADPAAMEGVDWAVDICIADSEVLTASAASGALQVLVERFLEFFVLAARDVHVRLSALPTANNGTLGQGLLGINTVTTLSAN